MFLQLIWFSPKKISLSPHAPSHAYLIYFCLGDNSFAKTFPSLSEDVIDAVDVCCVCLCVGSPVLRDGVCQRRGLDVPHPEVAALWRGSGPVLRCRNYFSPHVSPWERHHLPVSSGHSLLPFVWTPQLRWEMEFSAWIKKCHLLPTAGVSYQLGSQLPPHSPCTLAKVHHFPGGSEISGQALNETFPDFLQGECRNLLLLPQCAMLFQG